MGGHREYRKYPLTSNGAVLEYSTPFIRSIPPYDAKGRDERKKKKKELNPGNSWECIEFKTEIGSLVRYQCNHG